MLLRYTESAEHEVVLYLQEEINDMAHVIIELHK